MAAHCRRGRGGCEGKGDALLQVRLDLPGTPPVPARSQSQSFRNLRPSASRGRRSTGHHALLLTGG